jgi:heme-degrading monooxygenase HmoA
MKHAFALLLPALLLLAGCASTKEQPMSAPQPKIILIVGGLKSKLSKEELDRRYKERMPQFRDVPGLVQKYYSYDEATQEWAGIYLWESEEALAAYLESDLKNTIAAAYELTAPPKIQRLPVIDVLRQ